MNGESHLIRQLYPAPSQVTGVRGCRFGFIEGDIPRPRGKHEADQGLAAFLPEVLSRMYGVVARGVRSTLR
jgi:hypothetical protein